MKYVFMIKYGEIAIKGKNRFIFENALIKSIKTSIRNVGEFNIVKEQGRILVEPCNNEYDKDIVISKLTKVFGIIAVSIVMKLDDNSMDNIYKYALEYMKETYGDAQNSFKVVTKRSNKKYPYTSPQICTMVGEYLLDNMSNLKVDVHNPDIKLNVEIRNSAYIYSGDIKGPGGMPLGVSGKSTLLLSGGIDSPVAGYFVARRGVEISGVYFHSHPYTSDRAKQKVVTLAKKLTEYTNHFKLYVVPFTEIQMSILEYCPDVQLTIIMRRIMMHIAEVIARKEGSLSLITGESIGQVASQTMQSLYVTDDAVDMPVFRPLIGFDKEDIVQVSKKIDTYETSILPYEDCCTIFVAKHPEIKPRLDIIKKNESRIKDLDIMIEKAINDTEIIEIK